MFGGSLQTAGSGCAQNTHTVPTPRDIGSKPTIGWRTGEVQKHGWEGSSRYSAYSKHFETAPILRMDCRASILSGQTSDSTIACRMKSGSTPVIRVNFRRREIVMCGRRASCIDSCFPRGKEKNEPLEKSFVERRTSRIYFAVRSDGKDRCCGKESSTKQNFLKFHPRLRAMGNRSSSRIVRAATTRHKDFPLEFPGRLCATCVCVRR